MSVKWFSLLPEDTSKTREGGTEPCDILVSRQIIRFLSWSVFSAFQILLAVFEKYILFHHNILNNFNSHEAEHASSC